MMQSGQCSIRDTADRPLFVIHSRFKIIDSSLPDIYKKSLIKSGVHLDS